MSLDNQIVVIIGGTSGIGLAVSKAFVEAGAKVIVASRSAEKLKTAQSKLGGKVAGYTLDFRDVNALDEFFQEVGPLDHL
ncbi:MAG: SDR family NAD(P)-dependent oxidoreductase, partial [Firmicutes bacterium]|nr:SDR family NAD(P)-dependent oxidoreductase [Bacillota bacterium]